MFSSGRPLSGSHRETPRELEGLEALIISKEWSVLHGRRRCRCYGLVSALVLRQ